MLGLSEVLVGIPDGLRGPLIKHYRRIAQNYVERRWEPSELNAGKLCEVVYSIVDGAISGTFPTHPSKPGNFLLACRKLENAQSDPYRSGDQSLRILIPRVLVSLYEVRNNRGVGHVAGDVDSNPVDATFVFGASNWLVCELVRIFHGLDIQEANSIVKALVERRLPEIWEVGGKKRVLAATLSARDKALLLIYSEPGWVNIAELREWIEYKNPSQFRKSVLAPLHTQRLVEVDEAVGQVQISPKGALDVENFVLPKLQPGV